MGKKEKITGYSNIRIIDTLLVVVGHATSLGVGAGEKIQNPYAAIEAIFMPDILEMVRQLIYFFHMPLFVVLSGALFMLSYKHKKLTKSEGWIRKRAKQLLIPYILVAVLFFVPVRLVIGYNSVAELPKIIFKDVLIGKDINYLWYAVMLFEVDCIMFILRKLVTSENIKLNIILFGVFFVISLIPHFCDELPFQLHRTMEFLIWFFIGIKVEQIREKINQRCSKYEKFLNLIILVAMSVIFLAGVIGNIVVISNAYVLGFSGSIAVTAICFSIPELRSRFFDSVERRSFQIYLYHVPLMYLYTKIVHMLVEPEQMSNMLYFILVIGKMFCSLIGALVIDKMLMLVNFKGRCHDAT